MKKWLAKFRPQAETPDAVRDKAVFRLSAMQTHDLLMRMEAELGEAWRAFDRLQDNLHPVHAEEFHKHALIVQGGAQVLRDRFTES